MGVEEAAAAKAKGNAAFTAGHFSQAIQYFTEAIKHNPSDHVFYSNRSGAYASLQQWKEALADADECIRLKPDFIKGYNRAYVALFNMQQYEEAKKRVQQGLQIDPNNESLKQSLSEVEQAMTAAADPMARMFGADMWVKLQADPVTRAHLSDPSFVQKMKMIQQNPKLFASMTGDPKVAQALGVLFGLGANAFQSMPKEGENTAAASMFNEEDEEHDVEIDATTKLETTTTKEQTTTSPSTNTKSESKSTTTPESSLTAEQKEAIQAKEAGNTEYKKKNFEAALKQYQRAIEIDPNNIVYYNNIAAVYYETKQYDKVIENALKGVEVGKAAMASFKDIAKAYGRIGNAYAAQDQFDQAIDYYNKSLVEEYDDKIRTALKRTEELKTKREAAAYIDADKSEEHKAKGNQLFQDGKWAEAIAEYTEALKRNPKNYKVYSNRAACYTKLMDWQRGLEDCDACLAQDPTFVKALLRKGKIQHFLKQYHKALETYNNALEIEPTATEVREARMATLQAINSGQSDPERAKEAMKDPEIVQILQDPTIQKVLQDLQTNPELGQQALLRDADIRAKIEKLIAAGVLAVK